METIVISDHTSNWDFLRPMASVVEASEYLSSDQYLQNKDVRVINLCESYEYQSTGYYVSLLAQARDHKAVPSILQIQDVLNATLSKQVLLDVDDEIQRSLNHLEENECVLSLYFGQNTNKKYDSLSKKLHGLFSIPLIQFSFERKKQWEIKKLTVLSCKDISPKNDAFMHEAAQNYLLKKRFYQCRKKQRFHDLAILIDATEPNPPSNRKALDFFVGAGEELGLNVDFIDKHDNKAIAEYDALFIRATTSVDHYTYRFARRAAQENVVVMDDAQSIVRCSNKIYLAELMRSHQILTPPTLFLSKHEATLPLIEYPCVIKKPDGAFSQGVVKLNDKNDLQKSLKQFFKTSDLVLIQPFIPTQFDWRIGVLDNKPLFASRYYMAKGHWQIYNWMSSDQMEGKNESIPLNKVPEAIIRIALKATRLIGNSLYGVDIKSIDNKHYVIEVNDNPNIDAEMEDQAMGESLYRQVMTVFLQRIRRNHGYDI